MAEIDVTDILLDADVAGISFDVLRRQETVDDFGISNVVESWIVGVVGSVQPTGDNSLVREEASDLQMKSIEIVTPFRLRGVSKSPSSSVFKPDRVHWAGDFYEVRVLDDWAAYGGGMTKAELIQIDYVGDPPRQTSPYVGRLDFSQVADSSLAHGAGM